MTDEAKALAKAIRKEVCNCHICGLCGWKPKRAADLIETQAREIERLREALRFYARKYSWRSCGVYMCGHSNPSSAEIDRGDKARAALGESHD